MTYKTADDVFREKEIRDREEYRKKVVNDLNKTWNDLVPKPQPRKKSWGFIGLIAITLFILFLITLALGWVWFLKSAIEGVFG